MQYFDVSIRQWSVAAFLGGAVLVTAAALPQLAPLNAAGLLEAYDHGDYETVVQQLATSDVRVLDRFDADLGKRAKEWVTAAGSPQTRRRTFVAGALALELTHELVGRQTWRANQQSNHATNPEALPEVGHLISRFAVAPDSLGRDWALAQLAAWQEWNSAVRNTAVDQWLTPEPAWAVLLGKPTLSQLSRTQTAFGKGGYLQEILTTFPSDARFLLAWEEGRESIETRCAIEFCFDEMTPATLDQLRRQAKSTPPETDGLARVMGARVHEMAVANLKAFDLLLPAASRFAALANTHSEVRAEANVHVGYLAIRASRPEAALRPLADAVASDDPFVRYLAEYFTGRAFEALGRRPEAIAAYRRALVIVPNASSATMLLAAQLFAGDDSTERAEAYSLLHAAQFAAPSVVDPWDRYWYGDARLWPVYMQHLRQALRQ